MVLISSGNASELFNDVPSNVTQAVVIVDSEDSFTAKEALMELGHYRNVSEMTLNTLT